MKNFKLNKLAIAAIAVASIASVSAANACSRLIMDGGETHGVTVARSFDWGGSELQSIAKAYPAGVAVEAYKVPEYKNPASWTVKHHTVDYVEVETFHGTSGEAINDKGLSASLLYQNPSVEFVKDAADNGAPTVHMSQIVNFLVTQFATVDEAVNAFEAGEFQTAWKTGIGGHQHGFHFSVQDKSGDIALFQLNEGGKMVVHRGDINSDLRVMANMPLRQDILEHAKKFDLNKAEELPSDISSPSRYIRGYHATTHAKLDPKADWVDTRGKMKGIFDFGNKVPQDLIDPTNGESYATWETYIYNLETGDTTYYNEGNGSQININFAQTKAFTEPMCADMFKQARAGEKISWGECK
ncbi:linear amide C-N hydrolase [Shewanella sp. WXL01]|uniref:Linear amide C-N hydrolase n=1 Tax=Shewanella maritima TaxID=2520507 RepID=A0A411PGZ6_9GAMM|nr:MULTISPECIES: linear amide C-N hydrolase [Shewanella]NKF49005.1 linear amide C-N hydrolase [Shewanella sp. WXL01]QBF82851.1 linear amide C-N hydrolase [Shewanella maritima]